MLSLFQENSNCQEDSMDLIELIPGRREKRRTCRRVSSGGRMMAWAVSLSIAAVLFGGCRSTAEPPGSTPPSQNHAHAQTQQTPSVEKPEPKPAWPPEPGRQVSLFDGKTLGQWKPTDFGGQGEVHIKDGAIYMDMGSYMTGITWAGPVVRMSYEITLEAMRVQGSDFFCGLTFPVGEKPCTLVLGGWGGSLCGFLGMDPLHAPHEG